MTSSRRIFNAMNILVYNHLRNIYGSTGVGRVARELTEQLAQRQEVRLQLLADRGDHADVIGKLGEPWTQFQYRFMAHETSHQQLMWFLLNRPAAESYWPEADIIYCTAESYVPVRHARLVVTCHDMQLFDAGVHSMSSSLLRQRAKWWLLYRRLRSNAALFHTISNYSAERLAHYFPDTKSRIAVIPNAVSEAFFSSPTATGDQVLESIGLVGRPYLLVPGGLNHRKNADLILQAWPLLHKRFPDLALVVTSHNSPQYLARAQAQAPSMILAGYRGESELVALYAKAQLVWFPSRYEGFGMPVLEAMACGAPVVTTNSAAIPEVAGKAAAALLSPDDPHEHVEAITALLHDSAARQDAREKGIERARQFRWSKSADLLLDQFRLLL